MEICSSQISENRPQEIALWLAVIKNELDYAERGCSEARAWFFAPCFAKDREIVCSFACLEVEQIQRLARSRIALYWQRRGAKKDGKGRSC